MHIRKKVTIIFSKFLNLEPEKRERIINAALKEFAQKGYEKASTNEIVKEADISKGLLFHYFHNKKDLFLFSYDYSLELFRNEFFEKIDLDEKDVLVRLGQMARLKMDLIGKHPEMFKFILMVNFENSTEVKNNITNVNREVLAMSYQKLFEGIDIAKFKEGIDIKKAINIIIWSLEGYATGEQEKVKLSASHEINYKEVLAEMDIYLDLFRKCFYKQL